MSNIKELHDERLKLSVKPILTIADKSRLKELNELLKDVKWVEYYYYNSWLVGDYLISTPRFLACDTEGKCLRANTKIEIERLIDNEYLETSLDD